MNSACPSFSAVTSVLPPENSLPAHAPASTSLDAQHVEETSGTRETCSPSNPLPAASENEPQGALPDSEIGENIKPPGLSYIALISMAIQSAADKRMLLSEIYTWIADRYPYYRLRDKSWRNSIRHNLSLNECFVKSGRSENGKGNYWSIHPANIDDFSRGDYRRRRARRRVRKCDEDLQRLCSSEPEPEELDVSTQTPICSEQNGYVPMASTLVPSNFLSVLGVEPIKSFDYWFQARYPQLDVTQRPPMSMFECQDPSCLTSAKDYNYTDNSFQRPYFQPFGMYADHVGQITPAEVNVNVNVNVCGNGSQALSTSATDTLNTQVHNAWRDSAWQITR